MRVGFDAKRIFNNRTGLGGYGRNLVANLISQYPDDDFYLFTPQIKINPAPSLSKAHIVQPQKGFNPLWRQWGIDKEIKKYHLDIFHGLSNEIPFKLNKTTRFVCTLHDVIWLKFPELYKPLDRLIYTQKLKFACKNANLLIATSQQTADDLQSMMKVPSNMIQVVYQTGPDVPLEINPEPPISEPYFLYISTMEERKNHISLLKAFSQIENRNQHKLIFAGRPGNTSEKVKKFIAQNGLQTEVRIIENINESEKFWWLKHAKAFVYPSLYEGFGIPLIEAMKTHTSLILSNLDVFKEIAGNEAQYFNPTDADSLKEILQSVIYGDLKLPLPNTSLLEKFTPSSTSNRLMEAYKSVL